MQRASAPKGPSPERPAAATAGREASVGRILDALHAIARQLRLASQEAADQARAHPAQRQALRQLADRPVASLTELAERTHTDISSVSMVVSRLVEHGLVTRKTAADDRRRISVALTPRGRAVVRRSRAPEAAGLLRAASTLSGRELHALADGLSGLASALRE